MSVESVKDYSRGSEGKPFVQIVVGEDCNHVQVNGVISRLAKQPKGTAQKNRDAIAILRFLAEKQGLMVSPLELRPLIEQTIPPGKQPKLTAMNTRIIDARNLLLYRLLDQGIPIVSSREGSLGTEIGIVNFAVNVRPVSSFFNICLIK